MGGGYCRLQTPLRPALGVRGTVAERRLGALEGGGGGSPPFQCTPALPPPLHQHRMACDTGALSVATYPLRHGPLHQQPPDQ